MQSATNEVSQAHSALGVFGVLVSMLSLGAGSVVIKLIELDGPALLFYRFVFSVPMVALLFLFSQTRLSSEIVRKSFTGGILFGAHIALYFLALKYTSVSHVVFIAALQPLVLSYFSGNMFGEKVTKSLVVTSLIGVVGVGLLVFSPSFNNGVSTLTGDALAFMNLLVLCAYFVASKKIRQQYRAVEYQGALTLWASLFVIPIGWALAPEIPRLELGQFWQIFFISLVPGLLGHLVINWAHKHVDLLTVSLLLLGTPVVATLGAIATLEETLTLWGVVGAGAVFFACGVTMFLTARPLK